MDTVIITGLLERREALIAQVKEAEAAVRELISNIEHLDIAITMFQTGSPARGASGPLCRHGHVTRMVLTILRKSPEPMTLRAPSLKAMESLGPGDGQQAEGPEDGGATARTALGRQKENGVVTHEMGKGGVLLWKIMG